MHLVENLNYEIISEMACDPAQHADLGAILLHEGRSFEGLFSQITGDHVRPNHAA